MSGNASVIGGQGFRSSKGARLPAPARTGKDDGDPRANDTAMSMGRRPATDSVGFGSVGGRRRQYLTGATARGRATGPARPLRVGRDRPRRNPPAAPTGLRPHRPAASNRCIVEAVLRDDGAKDWVSAVPEPGARRKHLRQRGPPLQARRPEQRRRGKQQHPRSAGAGSAQWACPSVVKICPSASPGTPSTEKKSAAGEFAARPARRKSSFGRGYGPTLTGCSGSGRGPAPVRPGAHRRRRGRC